MAAFTLAIDMLGGDSGLSVTIPACVDVLSRVPDLSLVFVGPSELIEPHLQEMNPAKRARVSIQHATEHVEMSEDPRHALRRKKDSSMRVAIDLVKSGRAVAMVSAGNTGALMAMGKYVLGMIPGADRPAIMSSFPTMTGAEVSVLDLGANVNLISEHLYQFAVMGSVATEALRHIKQPRVALLNVGQEAIKGNDLVKSASKLIMADSRINYVGYVEGDHLFEGVADVVVCDGFVGNIMLKSVKGAVGFLFDQLKLAYKQTFFTRIIGLLSKNMLRKFAKQYSASQRNGAMLLGLNGIVVKSHGNAGIEGFANAIVMAADCVRDTTLERMVHRMHETLAQQE